MYWQPHRPTKILRTAGLTAGVLFIPLFSLAATTTFSPAFGGRLDMVSLAKRLSPALARAGHKPIYVDLNANPGASQQAAGFKRHETRGAAMRTFLASIVWPRSRLQNQIDTLVMPKSSTQDAVKISV